MGPLWSALADVRICTVRLPPELAFPSIVPSPSSCGYAATDTDLIAATVVRRTRKRASKIHRGAASMRSSSLLFKAKLPTSLGARCAVVSHVHSPGLDYAQYARYSSPPAPSPSPAPLSLCMCVR
eukprot:5856096-Pleurochrysis_carterae.AAC.1